MKKQLFLFGLMASICLSLASCVENCEGECDVDENGKLDCPCDI